MSEKNEDAEKTEKTGGAEPEEIKKAYSPLVSLLTSIVIPAIILSKFSNDQYLGVLPGFLIALAFPVGQGIYEIVKDKKPGILNIIGLFSTLLTGIVGVLQLPSEYIAYKEAAVPLIIGLAVVLSLKTPYPLVKKLIYNDTMLDMKRIEAALDDEDKKKAVRKALDNSTYMIGASFLLSSALNFTLAKLIVTSPSGTEAFNAELGKLTALSYPLIALPSTIVMMLALWYLISRLKKITSLSFEELLSPRLKEK